MTDKVGFCKTFTDGAISAGTSNLVSSEASFSKDMVGRSILIMEAGIATTYIGKEYIISDVSGNSVTLVSGSALSPVEFNTSASEINFSFPPAAGIKSSILTDLKKIYKRTVKREKIRYGFVYEDKKQIQNYYNNLKLFEKFIKKKIIYKIIKNK